MVRRSIAPNKGFLTSSCCPALVDYIKKHVPELADKVSHNLSPVAEIGKLDKNFIEGMACVGGCVGGVASLNHEAKSRVKVDKYGKDSDKENVRQAIDIYKFSI